MHGTRSVSGFAFAFSVFALACGGGESPPPAAPTSPSPPAASMDVDGGGAAPAPAPVADGAWPFNGQSAEEKTAQIERLKQKPNDLVKSNWTPPGQSERYGHAEGIINVAPDKVRAKLTDFDHYDQLAGRKFKSVKVVDKPGTSTDVYFQLPIMKGAVVIWYVTRFAPVRSVSGGDVIDGTFVKGNIKSMHLAFTVRPGPDANSSIMVCDLLLQPTVPAPQSALDEELRDACGDAINSVKRTTAP